MLRSFRFRPWVSRALLRFAALVLLAQTLLAWALLLGAVGGGFTELGAGQRNLAVISAVLCPVAATGAWFISDWGPILWMGVIVALGAAVSLGAGGHAAVPLAFLLHVALLGLWLVTAARVERRHGEAGADGPLDP